MWTQWSPGAAGNAAKTLLTTWAVEQRIFDLCADLNSKRSAFVAGAFKVKEEKTKEAPARLGTGLGPHPQPQKPLFYRGAWWRETYAMIVLRTLPIIVSVSVSVSIISSDTIL